MMSRVYYTKPSITELETSYATDAARNGWGEHCYDYIYRFEDSFKQHLGSRFAIATSSCTGALHLGLAALGIGPGDEVILADSNWIATVSPIIHLGATPTFVDILPNTWCIDPAAVERAITSRTKAIVAVHLYGNLCEMDRLLAIGRAYGITIVEDAAEALGSQFRGRRAGTMGRFGVYSFHGSKTITTGEGGMLVTDDEVLYETALTLSNHGRARSQPKQFWPELIGYKYKISNIQAAIGCAQVTRIAALIDRKRAILARYRCLLSDISTVAMNPEPEHVVNGAWMPTVIFDAGIGITRDKIQAAFEKQNIDARVFFHPLSSLPMFKAVRTNIHAWDIPTRAINLPSFHDMTDEAQDRVVRVLRGLLDAESYR